MAILRRVISPVISEAVRVSLIMGAGDVVCQTLVDKRDLSNLDAHRTLKFAGLGLLYVGPALRIWYGFLNRVIATNQKPLIVGVKKMALDQLLFAPVFTVSIMGVVGKLNGETNQEVQSRIKSDYWTIMSRNYMLWPAAQVFNFAVVPFKYQVIFAQVVAVVWNTYLSMMLNSK